MALRPSSRKPFENAGTLGRLIDEIEHLKASARAKVEHPFRVIKRQLGHVKVRYRGAEEEHGAADDAVRAVESVDGAQEAAGTGWINPSAGSESRMNRAETTLESNFEWLCHAIADAFCRFPG